MDDRLLVQCGHCGARYAIDHRIMGRRARCRRCRHVFRLAPKANLDDTVLDWLEEDAPRVAGLTGRSLDGA
ncbi:MAG: hypothetical protein JXQ73_04120 [Phycisphaerae bacterium]|nr:hypothetical protein [Phycisphaerae bacterium]